MGVPQWTFVAPRRSWGSLRHPVGRHPRRAAPSIKTLPSPSRRGPVTLPAVAPPTQRLHVVVRMLTATSERDDVIERGEVGCPAAGLWVALDSAQLADVAVPLEHSGVQNLVDNHLRELGSACCGVSSGDVPTIRRLLPVPPMVRVLGLPFLVGLSNLVRILHPIDPFAFTAGFLV